MARTKENTKVNKWLSALSDDDAVDQLFKYIERFLIAGAIAVAGAALAKHGGYFFTPYKHTDQLEGKIFGAIAELLAIGLFGVNVTHGVLRVRGKMPGSLFYKISYICVLVFSFVLAYEVFYGICLPAIRQ